MNIKTIANPRTLNTLLHDYCKIQRKRQRDLYRSKALAGSNIGDMQTCPHCPVQNGLGTTGGQQIRVYAHRSIHSGIWADTMNKIDQRNATLVLDDGVEL